MRQLGFVAVLLWLGACSSKDPLLVGNGGTTGSGGISGGGGGSSAGTTGAGGVSTGTGGDPTGSGGVTTGSGGTGGLPTGSGGTGGMSGAGGDGGLSCGSIDALCGATYRCVLACGATPVSDGCCPCQPPYFDEKREPTCADGGTPDAPLSCRSLTTLAACDARADCHPVFRDPGTCGCAGVGCCARFDRCADGATAACSPGPSFGCDAAQPFCEGPAYVVSYFDYCFEGCVRPADCAP